MRNLESVKPESTSAPEVIKEEAVEEAFKPESTLTPISTAPVSEPVTSASGFQSPPASAATYFRWDDSGSGYDPFSIGQTSQQQQEQQDFSFGTQQLHSRYLQRKFHDFYF